MLNMTQQEIFDTVAKHLFTQGRQGKNNFAASCSYRAQDGSTCAVGCLIPDNLYSPAIESASYSYFGDSLEQARRDVFEYLGGKENEDFLYALQRLHDNNYNWETENKLKHALRGFAIDHNVSAEVLDTLTLIKKD
jgi:hypothetical protein